MTFNFLTISSVRALLSKTNISIYEILMFCLLFTFCIPGLDFPFGIIILKEIWFNCILGMLLIICSLAFIIKQYKFYIKLNSLDFFVISYVAYAILKDFLLSKNPQVERIVLLVAPVLLFFLLKLLFLNSSKINFRFFEKLLFIQLCILETHGILQYFKIVDSNNYFFKITGFFFNPAPYAIYLSALMSFQVSFLIFSKNKREPAFLLKLGLILIAAFILIMAMSRASWIGFLVSLSLISLVQISVKNPRNSWFNSVKYKWAFRFFQFLLFCFLAIYMYSIKINSALGRIFIWKISATVIHDNFFTGVGTGQFPVYYSLYQKEFFKNPVNNHEYGRQAGDIRFAFNDIIQTCCEQGVIGVIFFAIIIGLTYRYFFELISEKSASMKSILLDERRLIFITGTIGITTCVLIAGLFSYPLSILPINILFWVSVSIISGCYTLFKEKSDGFIIADCTITIKIVIFLILVLPGFFYLRYGIRQYQAYAKWRALDIHRQSTGSDYYATHLAKLRAPLSCNGQYLIAMGWTYLELGKPRLAKEILEYAKTITPNPDVYYGVGFASERMKDFRSAEENYLYLYYCYPNLFKPKFLLAKLYHREGRIKEFTDMSDQALRLTPMIASEEVSMMKKYLYKLQVEVQNLNK
jgi:O-antigen polymerase